MNKGINLNGNSMVESDTKTPQKNSAGLLYSARQTMDSKSSGPKSVAPKNFMYCNLLDLKPRALVTAGDNGKASDNVCGGG